MADSRHRDSMSGIRFPAITGYFSHYCQNRSQKLPRIITGEVWERTKSYLHTLYRSCITNQTSGPASYAEGPEVQISSVAKLKFTMELLVPFKRQYGTENQACVTSLHSSQIVSYNLPCNSMLHAATGRFVTKQITASTSSDAQKN